MSFVRALLVAVVVVGVAVGRLVSTPTEIPHRGSLDDLRSDAAYLLEESDGVYRVERLVAVNVSRRRHRIIQIADLHPVPFDDLADDLRDQDATVSDEDVRQEYFAIMAAVRRVQRSQRALIRWLSKYHGVDRVFLEGWTDENLPAYLTIVRALGRADANELPPQFGAAAQSLLVGDLKGIAAAEDEATYVQADPFAGDDIAFEGAANDAREAAIVRRLVAGGPLSVVVLGGAHDLSRQVKELGDCEYLRVFVEGWPSEQVDDVPKPGPDD